MGYCKYAYFMIIYLYFKRGVKFSVLLLEMVQDSPESVWNGGLIQEADQVVPSQKVITDLNQGLCLRVGSAVEQGTGRPNSNVK